MTQLNTEQPQTKKIPRECNCKQTVYDQAHINIKGRYKIDERRRKTNSQITDTLEYHQNRKQ